MTGTTSAASRRLPFVQGLRGVAVLYVVLYHAGLPLPGGFVGVDVFFVISGFVITGLLARESGSTSIGSSLATFYRRRVRRLLPALATMISVVVVVAMVMQSPFQPQQNTAKVAAGASVSVANFVLYTVTGAYFQAQPTSIPLLHTWSLSVEEQFYLVFPALLLVGFWIGARLGGRRLTVGAIVLSGVTAASFAVSLRLSYSSFPHVRDAATAAFYSSPTRAWEFAVGGLVALYFLRDKIRVPMPAALAAIGAFLVVVAGLRLDDTTAFPGFAALVPVCGTALVIVGCRAADSPVRRALSQRWLVSLGDLSYSWYLWHWPVIVFVRLGHRPYAGLIGAVLSLPIAYAAYRFVETPIRYRVPTHRFATTRLVGTCVLVPMALSAILLVGAERGWGSARIRQLAAEVDPVPWGYDVRCHNGTPLPQRNLAPCTRGDGAGRPIIILGDSNAAQYGEGLEAAAEELGRPVTVATAPWCPFVDIEIHQEGIDWSGCRAFVVESTNWLSRHSSATFVLAATNEMTASDDFTFTDPVSGRTARTPEAKAAVWADGLTRTIAALRAEDRDVVLVSTIPHFFADDGGVEPWWAPTRCGVVKLALRFDTCSRSTPRTQMDSEQRLALTSDHQAAVRADAYELDLRDTLCPGEVCQTKVDNRWIYRDGWHVTTNESRRLAPIFTQALAQSQGS